MFDLTLQGNIFIALFSGLILVWLMVRYRTLVKTGRKNKLYLVAWILRSIVVILTILILFDPYINLRGSKTEPRNISVYIDNSGSMKYQFDGDALSIDDRIEQFIRSLKDYSDNVNVYEFGDEIEPFHPPLDFRADRTDFSGLPAHMVTDGADIRFVMSDGIPTAGVDPGSLDFTDNKPVYTIGVGKSDFRKDIQINRVEYPFNVVENDTVNINVVISFQSKEEIKTRIQITDAGGKSIADHPLQLSVGEGTMEISIPIVPDRSYTSPFQVQVLPVPGESRSEDNTYLINMDVMSENEEVLVISGSLSPNTSFIKSTLRDIPHTKITHYFRVTDSRWNNPITGALTSLPKLIILDDYPSFGSDKSDYDRIIRTAREKLIPVVFFEGPAGDRAVTVMIALTMGLKVKPSESGKSRKIVPTPEGHRYFSEKGVETLPPVLSNNIWTASDEARIILSYSDGSPALLKVTSPMEFLGVFIPDLGNLHLKMGNTDYREFLKTGVRDIIAATLFADNKLIYVKTDKQNFDKGEIIQAVAGYNRDLMSRPDHLMFQLVDDEGKVIREIPGNYDPLKDEYFAEIIPESSGIVRIRAAAVASDEEETFSDNTELLIQETEAEYRNLTMNRKSLLNLSKRTGGRYFELDRLQEITDQVDLSPVRKPYSVRFSAVSTHPYWWIIILLLGAEWFVRKRIGLL